MVETSKRAPVDILILGGGISGLTSAVALTKLFPKDVVPRIQIFEIRPVPATIGGGVNLTPNALTLLDHLGALKIIKERGYGMTINAIEVFDLYGSKIAESSFRGRNGEGMGNPPQKALRIARGEILKALLAVIETCPNITLTCDRKTTNISETTDSISLTFADGTSATGDILLGCDGIHSITRLAHVEPERKAVYSGVCAVFGFAPYEPGKAKEDEQLYFEATAINFARRGMLLTSFHSPAQDSMYVGILKQQPEIASRDGWKAHGADELAIRADIHERFQGAKEEILPKLIDATRDFYFWPVFTLSKHGKWATDRCVLLGDSAHAMPPQGQSTGIVFEDAVLLSRCLARWIEKGLEGIERKSPREAFEAYEKLRRNRIEVAFNESKTVVRSVNDAGAWGHWIKMMIIPWYLWWTNLNREKHFSADVTTSELNY